VDVTAMDLGDVLHMSDLKMPAGVELTAHVDEGHDLPVVSIHAPRAAAAEGEEDEGEAEPEGEEV